MNFVIIFLLFICSALHAMEPIHSHAVAKQPPIAKPISGLPEYEAGFEAFKDRDFEKALVQLRRAQKKNVAQATQDIPLVLYLNGQFTIALKKACKEFLKGHRYQGYVIALVHRARGQDLLAYQWANYTHHQIHDRIAELEKGLSLLTGDSHALREQEIAFLRSAHKKSGALQRKMALTLMSKGTLRLNDLEPQTEVPFMYYKLKEKKDKPAKNNKENIKPSSAKITSGVTTSGAQLNASEHEKPYSLFGASHKPTILEQYNRLQIPNAN